MKERNNLPCPKYINLSDESIIDFYVHNKIRDWILKLWVLCGIILYVGILMTIRGFNKLRGSLGSPYPGYMSPYGPYVMTLLSPIDILVGTIGIFLIIIMSIILIVTMILRPKVTQAVGMTDKRAFYCEQRGNKEEYISSKIQLTTINFQKKPLNPFVYLLLAFFFMGGISLIYLTTYNIYPLSSSSTYPSTPLMTIQQFIIVSLGVFQLIIAGFIIFFAIIYRKRGTLTTIIGNTEKTLENLYSQKVAEMMEFIKSVHSKWDLAGIGIGIQTGLIRYGKMLKYVIIAIILLFIYIITNFILNFLFVGFFMYPY